MQAAKDCGADALVDARRGDLGRAGVRAATGGRGVDASFTVDPGRTLYDTLEIHGSRT